MSDDVTLDKIRPGWRLVLGVGTLALGTGVFLMATRVIPVSDDSFAAPRWILGLVGVLTMFMGASIGYSGLRDLLWPSSDGRRPALPRTLAWLLGASIVSGLGVISTWVGFGPGERAFSGGILGSALEGRLVFGGLGILFDAVAVGIWIWGIRRLLRGEEP